LPKADFPVCFHRRSVDTPLDSAQVARSWCSEYRGSPLPPHVLKALRGRLRIPHRVLNIPVPQEVLHQSGVQSLVGEGITCGMPEDMRVDMKNEGCTPADLRHQVIQRLPCKRSTLPQKDAGGMLI